MNKQEHLRFCIERFDHYFESVNNKGAFFLAIDTFMIGGVIALYPTIRNEVDCGLWINGLFTTIVFTGLISVLITLLAGIPFLRSTGNSSLYFGAIAAKSHEDFSNELNTQSERMLDDDYVSQIHELSTGLKRKYRKLQIAGYLVFAEFVLMVPLIVLLMNNIKR
jgi:Family of unknown function (DUF5706)